MTEPTGTPLNPATSEPVIDTAGQNSELSEAEARLRADLYLRQRLDYQAGYYQRRVSEFSFNSDRMLIISAFLMGISTVVSSSSIFNNSPLLPFITALLPAFATAVAAFRSLYQWERQTSIYQDAWLALQEARLVLPDEDYAQPGDYQKYFPQLVEQTEAVLRGEAGQWGQISLAQKPSEAANQPQGPATPPSNGE